MIYKRESWAYGFSSQERDALRHLNSPCHIQNFLDSLEYSADKYNRAPIRVFRDRKANCFDGALFAAAALRLIGEPPLLIDLRAVRDDDHVIAIFRRRNLYGAIAKSNFVGLRYREPIHRSLRELVLSYFEDYYNMKGEKTLRSYSGVLHLNQYDDIHWMTQDDAAEVIGDKLGHMRHYPLLSEHAIQELCLVDKRSFDSGLHGAVEEGIYRIAKT